MNHPMKKRLRKQSMLATLAQPQVELTKGATKAEQMLRDGDTKGLRVVGYARVSTDSSDQKNSLKNQLAYFYNYAENNGFKLVKECGMIHRRKGAPEVVQGVYCDEGISGTSLKRREAFKQMIADGLAGKFDLIISKDVKRFGRDVENLPKLIKDLKEAGVAVFFLDLKLSTLKTQNEYSINNYIIAAQEESRSKSDAVKMGILQAQQAGKFTSITPYGYDKVDGYLQLNQEEAVVVEEIFDMYLNKGWGMNKIANELNRRGVPTKKRVGKNKWEMARISYMLENPIYKGKQVQHTVQIEDVNRRTFGLVNEEEWIIHQFEHLRIVDDQTFELVQLEKQRRAEEWGEVTTKQVVQVVEGEMNVVEVRALERGETRHSSKFLFSNVLKCGNCGHAMKRKKRKTREVSYEWCCGHNDKSKMFCGYRNAYTEDHLIQFVKAELEKFRTDKAGLQWNFDSYIQSYVVSELDESKLSEIDTQIKEIEGMREKNFTLFAKDLISEEEYVKRNHTLQDQLQGLMAEQNKFLQQEKELQTAKLKYDTFLNHLEGLDIETLTNPVLRQLVSSITVETRKMGLNKGEEKQIFIEWRFLDKTEGQIFWDSEQIRHEQWERDHWYRDMTPEEIEEEKARELALDVVREAEAADEALQEAMEAPRTQ